MFPHSFTVIFVIYRKLLDGTIENVEGKQQRMQILGKQKRELAKNLEKQDQKLKDFRVLELIEEADMSSTSEENRSGKKAGDKE